MIDRTIVGWDGSLEADLALEWAARRAEYDGDGIILIDVEDTSAPIPGRVVTTEMVAERHLAADAKAQGVCDLHPGLRISTHIMAGDRLEELRRLGRPDTLIVVGTGARRGPRGRFHWSLGARLAATARGAVAVVPGLPEESRSTVVVGVDGTDVSFKAARFAAREARRLSHELIVVHAWLDPLVAVPDIQLDNHFLGELRTEHELALDSIVHSLRSSNPDLTVTPLLVQDAAHHALKRATGNASLLVVGSQRTHGIDRMLLGSVSHAMVIDIDIPTVIVGPDAIV